MRISFFAIPLLALALMPSAHAVPVPQTEAFESEPYTSSTRAHVKVDVQASTWAPRSVELQSRYAEASKFARETVPAIFVAHLYPIMRRNWGQVSTRIGLGFLAMERNAIVSYGPANGPAGQSLYIIPAHVGLEFVPDALRFWRVSPLVGAGVLPTYVASQESVLAGSESGLSLGYEAYLGTEVRLLPAADLSLAVAQTLGRTQMINLAGTSARAGLRFGF